MWSGVEWRKVVETWQTGQTHPEGSCGRARNEGMSTGGVHPPKCRSSSEPAWGGLGGGGPAGDEFPPLFGGAHAARPCHTKLHMLLGRAVDVPTFWKPTRGGRARSSVCCKCKCKCKCKCQCKCKCRCKGTRNCRCNADVCVSVYGNLSVYVNRHGHVSVNVNVCAIVNVCVSVTANVNVGVSVSVSAHETRSGHVNTDM